MIITEIEIHKKTIKKYGNTAMINKVIEEMSELTRELNDFKYGCGNINHIIEERVDVSKMLNKLDVIMGFKKEDIKKIGLMKMKRTLDRLEPDNNHALQID